MSDIRNLAKGIAQSTSKDIDAVLPRAVTVVQVKGRLVRVQYPGETEAGQTWYPTTEMGVTVGMTGVVVRMRGNAAYFQPLAMPALYTRAQVDAMLAAAKPITKRGVQSLTASRSTAGDIDFPNVPDGLLNAATGLKASTAYQVTVDVMISMSTNSSGSFRPVVKFPSNGTEQISGFAPPLTTSIEVHLWKWAGQVTSNAKGEISAMPSARWVSGSITSSRAELVLRVEPA